MPELSIRWVRLTAGAGCLVTALTVGASPTGAGSISAENVENLLEAGFYLGDSERLNELGLL